MTPFSPDSLAAVLRVHPPTWRADPAAVFDALAGCEGLCWLESTAGDDRWGRYTIAGCKPLWRVSLCDGLPAGVAPPSQTSAPGTAGAPVVWPGGRLESLTSLLRRLLTAVRAEPQPAVPYAPGWMGYLGYELGRHFERLPGRARRDTPLPDMHLGFYDAVAVHDRRDGGWRIVSLAFDAPPPGAGQAAALLAERLTAAEAGAAAPAPAVMRADLDTAVADGRLSSTFGTPEDYRRAVARCVEYIAAGDIFQVNISQRLTWSASVEPASAYRCLRRANPAWYSGYLAGEGWAVASSSPELFLRCRNEHIVTRPIKGTARRGGDADADAAAAAHLLASAKDNAELAMIIDLLRNDLGRVCRYGSVRVSEGRALEAHPTVFHLVGTVEGRLRPGCDLADLIAAAFPGGSITGAPKIRAMEIIDELEPVARGPYTGSLAHFGADGAAELSIIIRTAVFEGGRAHVNVGGGIVADSTPEGEYVETLDKARAVVAAIRAAERAAPVEAR
ncbi:MAG: aminodeoxychorismate synthase component I [Planctomycetes bacterium]|nr:aminodeoxychorismate synthase component I [Planctomycetota bacterium]